MGLVQSPQVLDANQLYAGPAAIAAETARNQASEFMARQALGAGTRSGSTTRGLLDIATQRGAAQETAARNAEIQAALANREAQQNALATGSGLLNQIQGVRRDITNANLGAGQVSAQLAQIPSPAAQFGSALGSVLGAVAAPLTGGLSKGASALPGAVGQLSALNSVPWGTIT